MEVFSLGPPRWAPWELKPAAVRETTIEILADGRG